MSLPENISFASDVALSVGAGATLATIFAFGGAALIAPRVARWVMPPPKETHMADVLPFSQILPDGRTVQMQNGEIARYYLLQGRDQSFIDPVEGMALMRQRKAFFDAIADYSATVRIHSHRIRQTTPPTETFPNEVAQAVARKWNEQFENYYATRNVICLSVASGVEDRLNDAEQALQATLARFGVFSLTQNPTGNPDGLTLGAYLGSLVSPLGRPAPRGAGVNLADVLATDVFWFGADGVFEITHFDRKTYASVMIVKRLGDEVSAAMTNEILSLDAELEIARVIKPMSRAEALVYLERTAGPVVATSFSPQVAAHFQAAKEMVDGMDDNKASLCNYAEAIIVYGDTPADIIAIERSIREIGANYGYTFARESGATQASWFMRFPSVDVRPRPYKLFSANIAMSFTIDNTASGFERSDWAAGPIARFRTASNTAYRHQFHINDSLAALGHGVVIAPTGSGKTVLMEFLSLMGSRIPGLRHFFFDRYQGTAIYNLAMGGKYISLNAEKLPWSVSGGMNPFMCEDTDENRSFLKLWVSTISSCDDNDSVEEISRAVDIAFDALDASERSLAAIYEAGFDPGSKVKKELARWVSRTQYGPIFNAQSDGIDITDGWLTTFDMTKLLDDPSLGSATVSYLMHRIRETMKRTQSPAFIFIDETEPLLKDPNFRKLFQTALQEFRKIRGVVISVFQRPEALSSSNVSELVRQQSGTYYLFQNPGARASDYKDFGLTDREMDFVLGRSATALRLKRSVLIKKPMSQESVVVDIDLSRLGRHVRLFSSSTADVAEVTNLYASYGEDWVRHYVG